MARYSIDDFADRLRGAYPDLDAESTSNIDLVKDYFDTYPDSKYLEEIENSDMLFASSNKPEDITPPDAITPPPSTIDEGLTYGEQQKRAQANRAFNAYAEKGSEAAPGFLKQLAFNSFQHLASVPSAVVGMTGWGLQGLGFDEAGESMIDQSEDLRKFGQDIIQEVIENDTELLSLQIWNEDEPIDFLKDGSVGNFWHADILKRSMASALPSMIEMGLMTAATKGVAGLGYLAKGKKALEIAKKAGKLGKFGTAGGVATGITLEGSETWNSAMEYAKSEGMTNEQAAQVAGTATAIAAPIKGSLEYLGFGRMAKSMGLKEIGNRELARIISGKTVSNMLARGGIEGLKASTTEGMTEWSQFMTDKMVEKGYKEGFTPNEYFNQTLDVIKEEGWSPEARASIHGGMLLGGTTGTIGGATKGFGRFTPENIRKRLNEVDAFASKMAEDADGNQDVIKESEIIRQERFHVIMAKATEGMDKEQRQIFVDNVREGYAPSQDFSPETKDDMPAERSDFATNEEKDHNNFLTSLTTKKALPIVPNINNATDEQKKTSEWKFWKSMDEIKELKPKDKLLFYIKSKEQNPLDKINKSKDKEKLYTIALRGIYDSAALGNDFDINNVTSEQKEKIVKIWSEKGVFTSKDSLDVDSKSEGKSIEWENSLNNSDIATIFENQTESESQIAQISDLSNIEMDTKADADAFIEEYINSQDDNLLIGEDDLLIGEDSLQEQAELSEPTNEEIFEASKENSTAPWLTSDVSAQLTAKGIPLEKQAKLTSQEASDILSPPVKNTSTVAQLKAKIVENNIGLPEVGSGSNRNLIKADYEKAIADWEQANDEAESLFPDTMESEETQEVVEQKEETEVEIPKNLQNKNDIFEAEAEIAELQKLDGVNIKRAPTSKGFENRIGDIKVDKDKQTKGTGTKIVNAFKKLLRAKGRDKIEIDVNAGSEGFWEKMGFTFVAETREGYPIMPEDNTSTINPPTKPYGRWTMEYDLTTESSEKPKTVKAKNKIKPKKKSSETLLDRYQNYDKGYDGVEKEDKKVETEPKPEQMSQEEKDKRNQVYKKYISKGYSKKQALDLAKKAKDSELNEAVPVELVDFPDQSSEAIEWADNNLKESEIEMALSDSDALSEDEQMEAEQMMLSDNKEVLLKKVKIL